MPSTARAIHAQLQTAGELTGMDTARFGAAESYAVGTPVPLFARIDGEKLLAELHEKQQAAQAAAEAAEAAETAGITFLPQIGIEDFAKVDLRVAEITACEPVKKSKSCSG